MLKKLSNRYISDILILLKSIFKFAAHNLTSLGIAIAKSTGLRIGEICALQWGDIDFDLPSVHFHSLRHMFATNCVRLGFEVKALSEILGHSSVEITLNPKTYYYHLRKLREKCVASAPAIVPLGVPKYTNYAEEVAEARNLRCKAGRYFRLTT